MAGATQNSSGEYVSKYSSMSYYERLGVSQNCTDDELKRAYKQKALEIHPDRGGDSRDFQAVQEAYECLKDPKKRMIYDRVGEKGLKNGAAAGAGGVGDLFDMFFNNGGFNKQTTKRGQNKTLKIQFRLEEFATGCTRKHKLMRRVICRTCNGAGAPKEIIKTCERCNGTGVCVMVQAVGPVFTHTQNACSTCKAKGVIIPRGQECKDCQAACTVRIEEEIEIRIPAGAPKDYRIVLEGKGEENPDEIPGNLIILCEEAPHSKYTRIGENIVHKKSISLVAALCGHSYSLVDLLGETVYINITGVVAPDSVYCIKNRGIPFMGSYRNRGDLYIVYSVIFPTSLSTEHQQNLMNILSGERPMLSPDHIKQAVNAVKVKSLPTATKNDQNSSHGYNDDDSDNQYQGQGVSCQQA